MSLLSKDWLSFCGFTRFLSENFYFSFLNVEKLSREKQKQRMACKGHFIKIVHVTDHKFHIYLRDLKSNQIMGG